MNLGLSKRIGIFWGGMLILSLILATTVHPSVALASTSSSSKPIEAFEAVRNSSPQNKILAVKISRALVLDDSALSPIHSPIYDGTSSMDSIHTSIDNEQIYLYTVKDGDTVQDVAKMYDVSVNTILWANDISTKTSLKSGQVLMILPVNGVKYTVKKGDTVESIAKRFKSHTEDIVHFNALDEKGGQISIGDEIIIPDGQMESSKPLNNVVSKDLASTADKNGLIIGYFIRPVANGIKTQNLHGHNGIDIGAPVGSTIRATADGTVVLAKVGGWGGGYGNYVILQHPNGMQTLYGHMSKVDVSIGDSVTQGEKIGEVGSTGDSTGPHLHIEVHRKGGSNPPNKFY